MENFFETFHDSTSWGPRGHQLIAQTADELLTQEAAKKVRDILKPLGNIGLMNIATWADIIKNSTPKDKDSQEFLQAFKDRGRNWHFVDLPLEAKSYDRSLYPKFTRDDDVVQMINQSINILQGNDTTISELNALRWITHLVGDIHQPLHVACGYIDKSEDMPKLMGDPKVIEDNDLPSDHGGNEIILSAAGDKELNLHSYWDGMLGFKDVDTNELADTPLTDGERRIVNSFLEEIQTGQINSSFSPVSAGKPISEWAAEWATESLSKAREAYQSIVITEKINEKKFRVHWEGKAKYENRCLPIVEQQIKLATQRLSDLLNEIFK